MISKIHTEDIAVALVSTTGYLLYNHRVDLITASVNGLSISLNGSDLVLIGTVGAICAFAATVFKGPLYSK